MKTLVIITYALLGLLITSFKGPDKTLHNLQKAYQDEANASHRYELYAQKAEQEGYPEVAKLFQAASTSEFIHMENHKDAIQKLGGTPESISYEKIKVKTTRKNLKESIKDEGRESKYTYPDYFQKAKKENAQPAQQSFKYAQMSETEHRQLFKEALNNLGNNLSEDYYVNNVTGETIEVPQCQAPPVPKNENEEFIKIKL